jgi:isoleucyl-tRNA synthetase
LSAWPSWSASLIDDSLSEQMALARRLVELGRSGRAAAGTRTRQPLARALIAAPGFSSLPSPLRDLVAEELNVHSVSSLESAGLGPLVTYTVKPQFRVLGRRFGAATQEVAGAITAAAPSELARTVTAGGSMPVVVPSLGTVEITADDVIVTQTPLSGWGVATAGGETVALDLSVTPALRAEGLAREAIRLIQDARKNSGLEVTDRISLRWSADDPSVAAALTAHRELIASEVLASEFTEGGEGGEPGAGADGATPSGAWHEHSDDGLGLRFWFTVVPAAC